MAKVAAITYGDRQVYSVAAFNRGIATNYGGSWHQVSMTGLPERYIAGVTVDPSDPAHAYAIFNGYSRRYVPGGGVGHVFETWNGGQSRTDISGHPPDIAADPHYAARDMLLETVAGDGEPLRQPGLVPKLSATPGAIRRAAPNPDRSFGDPQSDRNAGRLPDRR